MDIQASIRANVERILQTDFASKVNQKIPGIPPPRTERAIYQPGSARYFYEPLPWQKAIESIMDPLGFFDLIAQFITKDMNAGTVKEIIAHVNQRFKERGAHVQIFPTSVPKKPPYEVAVHYGNATKLIDIGEEFGGCYSIEYEHPEKAKTMVDGVERVIHMEHAPRIDSTACILINEANFNDPVHALTTLAHEYGHYVEIFKSKPRDIIAGGRTYYAVVPETERMSLLYGLKMDQLIYTCLGDLQNDRVVAFGARNAAYYNHVMGIEQ